MDKNTPIHLQEIIFSSSKPVVSRSIAKLEKEGKLRKLAPKIFTPNFNELPETIIRRNIYTIIGHLYPGSVLSHRSAFEFKPTATNNLFLTFTYARKVSLPGLVLNILEGAVAQDGDNLITDGLYLAQQERAYLENLQQSRKIGANAKTLSLVQLEEKLEQVVRIKGEEGLNKLRDKAKLLSELMDMKAEYQKLNKIISAMLATKPSQILTAPVAIARALGNPFDGARISLFEQLFAALQQQEFKVLPEQNNALTAFNNFAFFEAYFSNYIEGTKFKIEEAKQIIDTGKPMLARDADSHDVLGTYQLVSNKKEMSKTPKTASELIEILQYRHKIILSARQNKNPGEFKSSDNQAGETYFVAHQLVRGTLIKAFDFYRGLRDPFAKAAYMMFIVSEIHPFEDGNGRVSRIMMNAELVKAGHCKIIIPSVYRIDYLGGLRALTRNQQPTTYIRMLLRAHLFSATILGGDIVQMQEILKNSNAFEEGEEFILEF